MQNEHVIKARWYRTHQKSSLDNEIVFVCELCPRNCKIKPQKRGLCYTRLGTNEELVVPEYAYVSAVAVDPIEKKPLYHFYPSSFIFSIGTVGCNLTCKFCQNYHISSTQNLSYLNKYLPPQEIPKLTTQFKCKSVAYTYNEPIVFAEYVIDSAQICKEHGIYNVVVSNGYISDKAREDFFKHIHAANIDLKAIEDEYYKKLCSAHVQPVLDTLIYLKNNTNIWFEITNLVIEDYNDDTKSITKLCEWIRDNLGDNIPLHFSAFYPTYKMQNHRPTSFKVLKNAYDIAKRIGLKYVYLGNVTDQTGQNTYCSKCGALLIERKYYNIKIHNLNKQKCQICQTSLEGHF